ncbi:MAG TPA: DMT family transporter [Ktedonobacteraceae bacterium]|nr:DMT family transporter [Ktedonobacteraceae bacterium]
MVNAPQKPIAIREGLLMGGLGVLCFSFTLPATRVADPLLGGTVVALGRAIVAALLAGILLLLRREKIPARRYWIPLALVALGVVVGFPLCASLALQSVPASHGAVVIGLLPAATAVMAVVRAGERPSKFFWLACAGGVLAVLTFAITQGAGHLQPADLLLLASVAFGAVGYAEGGRLAREMGGWRVICWALLLSAPLLVVPLILAFHPRGSLIAPVPWLGFAYVAVVSMFLGFFVWYRGLAAGGVARIGQIQLVQPILTVLWSAVLLHEQITFATVGASLLVVVFAALSQWTRQPQKQHMSAPNEPISAIQEE